MTQTGLPDLELVYREEGRTLHVTLQQTQPEPPRRLLVPVELLGKKGELHIMKADRHEAVTCWAKAAELRPQMGIYRDGLSRAKSI